MFLLQLVYTYLPVMNRLFQSAPIDPAVWVRTVAAGIIVFLIVEIEKRLWTQAGTTGMRSMGLGNCKITRDSQQE